MSDTTHIEKRVQDSTLQMVLKKGTIRDAVFQHSVLCQTFLPYRNPGPDVRIWKQKQGNVSLAIQAGETFNPEKDDFEFIGLSYGPKARLILAHVNSEAIRNQSKSINVEDSMSAFIKCIGLNLDGRTINEVKNQLRKLSSSTLSLGYSDKEKGRQVDLKIVKAFDIWFPKDEKQRVLWPSNIQLTDDYFNSLINHAIPLDERALAALSHSAMGLDINVQHNHPIYLYTQGHMNRFSMGIQVPVFRKKILLYAGSRSETLLQRCAWSNRKAWQGRRRH